MFIPETCTLTLEYFPSSYSKISYQKDKLNSNFFKKAYLIVTSLSVSKTNRFLQSFDYGKKIDCYIVP